ncbi:hypothetical protein EUTSA_v10027910mg [Eutrema salsugineum]|uniref:Uncharacterized protein n=1 Tax=Eutrema salsugineum TaxID=72664 RepID=V4NLL8_EUTSA|nr:uncharacterized protein LOC18022437 [Eutrema salsugineum]ESQ47316.1 hypothetical protein EUTSA_v10027910mg [Eutrema salsugineum]
MLPFPNYYISTPTMSEKKKIISSNSNGRKKRWPPSLFTGGGGSGGGGEDELATVKAAAWAWYQRNEGKPMIREFDLTTRATRTPRPSRYKLEANKNMNLLSENKVSKSCTNHLLREDQETKLSSLLDSYEIKSISKRIDEGSLPVNRASALRNDDHVFLKKKLEYDSKKQNGLVTKMSMRNLWKGMILMSPRTVCGRSDDVDIGAYRAGPRTVKVAPTSVKRRTDRR